MEIGKSHGDASARLLRLWERLQGAELSTNSRRVFLCRPELLHLAQFSPTHLVDSAETAMQRNPEGHLLLKEWLELAVATDGVNRVEPEGDGCSSCGHPVNVNGKCLCS